MLEWENRLHALLGGAIGAAADAGVVRDVPVGELASYCIDALAAARMVSSEAG